MTAAAEQTTDAVIATLAAGSGWPVGDHRAPSVTAGRYTIVTNVAGGLFAGSQANDHEMAALLFQVDSFGRSRRQCQHLADRNRALLLDRDNVTPTGWRVMYAQSLTPAGVDDEGNDIDGPLFCSRETFLIQIAPVTA